VSEENVRKPGDAQYMQMACEEVKNLLPDGYGFIIMAVPANNGETGYLRYASDLKREDAIKAVKVWLFRNGVDEAWMKHIK
jgi:hypothetical protein